METTEILKSDTERRYLEIIVSDKHYCVPLKDISEVVPNFEISSVPLTKSHFKGLINLRGQIISVLDLGMRIEKTPTKFVEKQTCIVIFNIDDIKVGALVDEVLAVQLICDSVIDDQNHIKSQKNLFVTGVIKEENKSNLRFLLDLIPLLDIDEIKEIERNHAVNG
ncbi:hypothetical protein A9Q84_16530 [Halobacteriovorax marinus]|uniref:CheW-like domain-containing protein n=1 Tax=Halobacteriovorax marinus TaxID=97084 RepID=A0A1Y5F4D5_9BACT|nr:hypothetical protein A9Q84_16530 [Halobacteriovorax marinus]